MRVTSYMHVRSFNQEEKCKNGYICSETIGGIDMFLKLSAGKPITVKT